MKNKIIIISSTAILLFTALVFFLAINRPKTEMPTPTGIPQVSPAPIKTSSGKINISGISTNDFLSNPIKTNSQGDVLFISTTDYQITYLRSFNQFIINISTSSAGIRDNAESAFLKKLGISKEDACRLSVFVSAPYVPNPYLSVQKRTLSFCVNY